MTALPPTSRLSLSCADGSPTRLGAVVLASLLLHGAAYSALSAWTRRSVIADEPAAATIALEFNTPSPAPAPEMSEPPPREEMRKDVPEVTQAAPLPDAPAPRQVDLPKPKMVPKPKAEAPKPQQRPVAPVPDRPDETPTPTENAAPPAPAAPPPPINPAWRRSLGAWIGANQVYPEDARRSGTEGNVSIRFTADRLGHVVKMEVVRSSGAASLDAAALAMLKGATLPPFPADMTQESLTITVQIHYSLTR